MRSNKFVCAALWLVGVILVVGCSADGDDGEGSNDDGDSESVVQSEDAQKKKPKCSEVELVNREGWCRATCNFKKMAYDRARTEAKCVPNTGYTASTDCVCKKR